MWKSHQATTNVSNQFSFLAILKHNKIMVKGKRQPKKPRGSRGERTGFTDGEPSQKSGIACDLMVVLPKNVTTLTSQLLIKDVMMRLSLTGFTHMALTHTIYGRPKPVDDKATTTIPESLWKIPAGGEAKEPARKKRKSSSQDLEPSSAVDPPIKVLRRLHAVVENISDVGCYLSNGPDAELLNEYDILSIAPRNDATFQAVCASATAADIITLDYSSNRGLKLPFKIRSSDVQAVVDRKAAFEINFAPALLKPKYRKALIQTCRELQMASLGKKPIVLFSSGDRTVEDSDVGSMALRLPGDLSNLMQALLHFDPTTASRAVGPAAMDVLRRAEDRRWGKTDVVNVSIGGARSVPTEESKTLDAENAKLPEATTIPPTTQDASSDDDEGGLEDGFISMI